MNSETTELAGCPFCGGAMHFESNRDWHRLLGSHTSECFFEPDEEIAVVPATDECRLHIVEMWNRRAPQPSAEPVAWMCPNDPDAASAFKWVKPGVDYSGLSCDACGGKHVRVFATPPAADSAADARDAAKHDFQPHADLMAKTGWVECIKCGARPNTHEGRDACCHQTKNGRFIATGTDVEVSNGIINIGSTDGEGI